MLSGINKIHFIGIGGAGMSALAFILLEKGYRIAGSDVKETDITKRLAKKGAKIFYTHQRENVISAQAVVISSAIAKDNVEIEEAQKRGIPIFHRSDINAFLLNNSFGIAVAGAHGKTTTTSMLGVTFDHIGMSPTIIIGGELDAIGGNAKLGTSEYLISEADESDGSFVKLKPQIAIVTNIEADHLDNYGTLANICLAFEEFLSHIKEKGVAILCYDSENVRKIARKISAPKISYAIQSQADYMAKNIIQKGFQSEFDVFHEDTFIGKITLNVPGVHNILNALAVVASGSFLGIPFQKLSDGLAKFKGAKRRFEVKGKEKGVLVVDDYGHHPTEIEATLKAAKALNPKRLICIFQPHRYTRTQKLQAEFGKCFQLADKVILTDIYDAGEKAISGISGMTIVESMAKHTGQKALYIEKRAEIAKYLAPKVQAGDLVMTVGAGDNNKTGEELLKLLTKN